MVSTDKKILQGRLTHIQTQVAKGKSNHDEARAIAEELENFKEIRYRQILADDVSPEKLVGLIVDNNGTISLKEISDIIKPNCEEDVEYLKDLIKSIDVNGDGEIDFDEFLKILGISVNNSLYK